MAIHKLTYWEEQINSIQWDKQQPNMTQPCCVEKWLTKGFKYAHTVRYLVYSKGNYNCLYRRSRISWSESHNNSNKLAYIVKTRVCTAYKCMAFKINIAIICYLLTFSQVYKFRQNNSATEATIHLTIKYQIFDFS